MGKIWHSASTPSLHPLIDAYTVGNDQALDQKLLGYDITASKAHASMLGEVGLINAEESEKLQSALDGLLVQWQKGTFKISGEFEDGHSAIESHLIEQLGPIGKKIHTARSRNDQALVMMRLYLKDALANAKTNVQAVSSSYKEAAAKAGETPMPGYTHTQKAMPTTVGTWLGSYADAFADTVALIDPTLNMIDQNPLGSAAGFGSALPIDRSLTTAALGFGKTQDNPMYCGLSRGFFEVTAVQSLTPAMLLAGKFAQDMLLFTTQEFDFFSLPDSFTTGSSIMPHKHNYDVFEIMRGHAHAFPAYAQQLYAIATGNGSGYNRDLQLTKGTTLSAFDTALETLEVLALCVSNLTVNKKALESAMTEELLTVAEIDKLVQQGTPFRDAYKQVKDSLNKK